MHGSDDRIPFEWRLDQQRLLKPENIFDRNKPWQRAFTGLVWIVLTQKHKDEIFTESGDRGSADRVALDSEEWLVDRSGFEILYPEYSIGPYSSGILTVKLSWDTLRPYFAPGFDPALLPSTLPNAGRQD